MSMGVPPDTPEAGSPRREVLAQLALLVDEIEALRSQIDFVPEDTLAARPLESEPSFIEIYGLIAHFDEVVYIPAVERLRSGDGKDVHVSAPASDDLLREGLLEAKAVIPVLERVQNARTELLERMGDLEEHAWGRSVVMEDRSTDVLGFAYAIARHDAALLQAAASRLHESRLSDRAEGPPRPD